MPQVSIIVPVYNAEKYIGRCIESIINQEFRDFELILVNDGSRDSSKEIIDSYAAKDNRIRCIHKDNSGVSDTRNTGIAAAQGEYIQFLDSDDWISAEATKLLVRTAKEKDADLVVADFYRVVGDRISPKGDIDDDEVMDIKTYGDHLMENPADFYYGVVWNKLYKTQIIRDNDVKMDKDISFCEDFIFNLEYALCCKRIAALRVPIYYYVKTEGSLVSQNASIKKFAEAKFYVLKYYDSFFKNIHSETGYKQRKADILAYLLEFAKDDPASPFAKKLGEESIPVFFPEGIKNNVFTYNYYENKMIQRLIRAVALNTGLKEMDVRVLMFLEIAENGATCKETASYLECAPAVAFVNIQRLIWKKYVEADKPEKTEKNGKSDKNNDETRFRLTEEAGEVISQVKTVIGDFESVRYEGFSEEEKEEYRRYEERAVNNIKRVLQDPNNNR